MRSLCRLVYFSAVFVCNVCNVKLHLGIFLIQKYCVFFFASYISPHLHCTARACVCVDAIRFVVFYKCWHNYIDIFIYRSYVYFIGGRNDDVRLFHEFLFYSSVHSSALCICVCSLFQIFLSIYKSAAWNAYNCIGVIASLLDRCVGFVAVASPKMHLYPSTNQ